VIGVTARTDLRVVVDAVCVGQQASPEIMNPLPVECDCRRFCQGSEKLGSVCVQYTCSGWFDGDHSTRNTYVLTYTSFPVPHTTPV